MNVAEAEARLTAELAGVRAVVTDRLLLPSVARRSPSVRVELIDSAGGLHAVRVDAPSGRVGWSSYGEHRFLGAVEDLAIEVMLRASRSRGASTLRVGNDDLRLALAARDLPLLRPLASRERAHVVLEGLGVDRSGARAVSDVLALLEVGPGYHERARPFLEAALSGAPLEWTARRLPALA